MKAKLKTLLFGVLAGASIGLGGLLYTICSSKNMALLGSLCFSIGLLLVCLFSLYLFTGKIGFVISDPNKKDYIINLVIGYLGNIIGAVGFGYLCFIFFQGNNDVTTAIHNIATKRLTDIGSGGTPFYTELIGAIFCGMLVYVAVYGFKKDWNIIARIFLLVFCVFAFVACGFEHCIANMFYVSMANMWNGQTILNILIVTFGNALGAILLNLIASKLAK